MSKKSNNGLKGIEHEEGSGNVFADLGLPDADERLVRSKLGFHVYKLLADRQLRSARSPPCSASSSRKYPT